MAKRLRNNCTEAEYRLWGELKSCNLHGYKFSRQIPLGPYIVDFVSRKHKLVIEVDGWQHANSQRDDVRTNWLNEHGYSVLRFWNHEVLQHRSMVLQMIIEALENRLGDVCSEKGFWPATSSPRRGEVPRSGGVGVK